MLVAIFDSLPKNSIDEISIQELKMLMEQDELAKSLGSLKVNEHNHPNIRKEEKKEEKMEVNEKKLKAMMDKLKGHVKKEEKWDVMFGKYSFPGEAVVIGKDELAQMYKDLTQIALNRDEEIALYNHFVKEKPNEGISVVMFQKVLDLK